MCSRKLFSIQIILRDGITTKRFSEDKASSISLDHRTQLAVSILELSLVEDKPIGRGLHQCNGSEDN